MNKIQSLVRMALVAILVAFAMPAFATEYGGYPTAEAAAAAMQSMSQQQRQDLVARLTAQQRTEVRNILQLGITTITEGGAGGSGGAGGQGGGGGTGQASAAGGDSSGQEANYSATSKSLALALSFTIPGHTPAPASIAAPQVGVVHKGGDCIPYPIWLEDGTQTVMIRKIPRYGRTMTVIGEDGKPKMLTNVDYEEWVIGYIDVVGFGADTESAAQSESSAGGVLSAFGSGGKSGSGARGTTSFKNGTIQCVVSKTFFYKEPQSTPGSQPDKPKAAAPARHLMSVEEDVTVPPRRGGLIARIGPEWCKQNPGKCTEVQGTPGKRQRVLRTFDCNAPDLAPADAKRCADGVNQAGKPAVVETAVIEAKK